MEQGTTTSKRKKRRVYKRIVIFAGGIISFIFVSGKAVPKKQGTQTINRKKITQRLNSNLSLAEEVKATISKSSVKYTTDRYSRNRWKRFISTDKALGEAKQDDTDYFEVNVQGQTNASITVQTLVNGRVAHCRLYGPGARTIDGNGFDISLESVKQGTYRFAVNGKKARGSLTEIYFKFMNGCEVLGNESSSQVSRTSIR